MMLIYLKIKMLKKTLYKIFEEMDKQKMLIKYYDGRGHLGKVFASIRIIQLIYY